MSGLRFNFVVQSPGATERTGTILEVTALGVLFRERRAHSKRYDQELIPLARVRAYGEGADDDTDWVIVSEPVAEIATIEGRGWKPGPPGFIEVDTADGPVFIAADAYKATAAEPSRHAAVKRTGKTSVGTPAPQKRRSGHTQKREGGDDFD